MPDELKDKGIEMKYHAFSIDDAAEEIFDELGSVQDGGAGHYCRMNAETPEQAAEELAKRLIPFFAKRFYESDDYGYKKELK